MFQSKNDQNNQNLTKSVMNAYKRWGFAADSDGNFRNYDKFDKNDQESKENVSNDKDYTDKSGF